MWFAQFSPLHKIWASRYDPALMYAQVPIGYIELMGIHSEWNARKHRWTPLGRNCWKLDFLMVDDGPERSGAKNPSVPLSVIFNAATLIDWQSVRMRLYFLLEDFKKALRR